VEVAQRKACPVCEGPEPRTVNRLLALGYGSRFVAARVPRVNRKDVRRHTDRCLPLIEDEVEADIESLANRRGRGVNSYGQL
jgi:hypothetical protein